jgi:hypothetical protein
MPLRDVPWVEIAAISQPALQSSTDLRPVAGGNLAHPAERGDINCIVIDARSNIQGRRRGASRPRHAKSLNGNAPPEHDPREGYVKDQKAAAVALDKRHRDNYI